MKRALELAKELLKVLEEKKEECKNVEQYELSTLEPGEVFKVGDHDFIVLEQMEGQTAVISKGFMAEDKKFDDETRDYNKTAFYIILKTEDASKTFLYQRYKSKYWRPTEKILGKLFELRTDLRNISNKKY